MTLRLPIDAWGDPNPRKIQQAVDALHAGGVAAYPTDSIYALLAGRARLFFSKQRTRLLSRVSGGFMIGGGIWLALTRAR